MYITLIILKTIHKFKHAYYYKKFETKIPKIKVAFIITTPYTYINTNTNWKLQSRLQRIAFDLTNMYFEIFITNITTLI